MKTVLILVGPKGAGKSTIGNILEENLGIHFLDVEPIFILATEGLDFSSLEFDPRGLSLVVESIKLSLSEYEIVCIETTGVSGYVESYFAAISKFASIHLVKVSVSPHECMMRIRKRSKLNHILVSSDRVELINSISVNVCLPWSVQIDNDGPIDVKDICSKIAKIINN